MKIDKRLIKELSEYLEEFNLNEIEFTEKDTKVKVSKNTIATNVQSNPASQNTLNNKTNIDNPNNTKSGLEIKSPIIGTAYHAP